MIWWFQDVKPWRGEPASHERFVWLSCFGIPLNAWNATTFKQIGELWSHFIKLDEETLRDSSFTKGKILTATEEPLKIDKWIQLEVQGLIYDVLIKEDFTCVNPDNLAESSLANPWATGLKMKLQKQGIARTE